MIFEFQVERFNLPVSLSLLWPGISVQNIYKSTQDPHFSDGEAECSIDNFSGQYFADGGLG